MATFIWIAWLVVGAALIVGEIFTVSFYLCLIGVSCLLAGAAAFFLPLSLAYIPLIVFLISVVLLVVFLRPVCLRMLYPKNSPKSGTDSIIGKTVTLRKAVTADSLGSVKVYSDMWKAASYNGEDIAEGKIVRIVGIDGNKLLVEPADEL